MSPVQRPEPHQGVRDGVVSIDGRRKVEVTTWLNQGRWMLVVLNDESTIRQPVRRALGLGGLVTAFAVLLLVATTVLATRHLTRRIDIANARRDELSRELMRSAKLASVGELATGLAHEINNPLAIISSERTNLSDVVQTAKLTEAERGELQESIDRIRRQVERCGNITAKMLQFGRKGESQPKLSNIGPAIQEVARLLHRQAAVRNVDFHVSIPLDLPLVFADLTELEQVLVNLINNSMHAMKNGGKISIAAKRSADEVSISVRDEGAGIPKDDLDRIFQPFFTTKPVGEGTGLGLSVCYGIVNSWGGVIAADSAVGHGTTMTIRLPIPASGAKTQDEHAR
jgi:two-component system NtrC family sensor kinase